MEWITLTFSFALDTVYDSIFPDPVGAAIKFAAIADAASAGRTVLVALWSALQA